MLYTITVDLFILSALAAMDIQQAREWHEASESGLGGQFLQRVNHEAYAQNPGIMTIAEESTSWPGVSKPIYDGGLGFTMKWDMGWMHDTLEYMALDPIFRSYEHHKMTFRQLYAFSENFVLPLSHDEVVHGKSSLLGKMPGVFE